MAWADLAGAVAGARDRFAAAAAAPRQAQEALLLSILARHRESEFGRRHDFAALADLRSYQRAVPSADAEAFTAAIAAIADGAGRILVDEPVLAFEETGGSSGGARLIPLTASGLACLREGLFAWLDDLQRARPRAFAGSSYWSISPATRAPRRTASGVPIGIESDAEYFGAAAPAIVETLAVPPAVAAIADVATWRLVTLQCLLADGRLALVSVWSPTFWLELCRHAVARGDELAAAIAAGRWAAPVPVAIAALLGTPRADPARARLVAAALAAPRPDWAAIWPSLALLSCWTHASSAPWAAQLAREFPSVEVQGKGLLATEGIVSVPLCDGGDPVAAVSSTVLEFEADDGRVHACDEVETGAEYGVLMTTSSGLYRYRLGDRVAVTGRWHAAPRLRLLGRAATGTDLCGEKLTEAFVMRCWDEIGAAGSGRLVPCAQPGPRYRLLVDAAAHDDASARQLADRLDAALGANPQYGHARRLGQLAAIAPRRVDRLAAALQDIAAGLGQRLGSAKPTVLGRLGEPEPAAADDDAASHAVAANVVA